MTALAPVELRTQDRIKSGPHWRVTIRPASFDHALLHSISDCWDTVSTRQVRVRGYDYPDLDVWEVREDGADWVAFETEWSYWRYYQSGLFVHLFNFWEDKPDHVAKTLERVRSLDANLDDSTRFLEPSHTVRIVSMIYLFAARLAARGLLEASAHIEISLNGVAGRRLCSDSFAGPVRLPRYCLRADTLTKALELDVAALIGSPQEAARNHAGLLFNAFGWDASDMWMRGEQERLGLAR